MWSFIILLVVFLVLRFKYKIIDILKSKFLIEINTMTIYTVVSIVVAIIALNIVNGRYLKSNQYIVNDQIEKTEPEKKRGEKYYIVNEDTIAEFLSMDGTSSNIWTKKAYSKSEKDKVDKIIEHLLPGYISMTHFLFTEKHSDNIDNQNYYGYYNNGVLTVRKSMAEKKEDLRFDMQNEISGTGIEFVTVFLAKMENFSKKIDDYDDNNKTLRKELIKFQSKNFPKARKEYFKNAKEQFWEKNIDVKLNGRNITFIGYMFVDNKVKKDTYEKIIDELTKLRFKRVSFQWYDGSETTYWNIDSKNDNEI